eukprot:scaffold61343_cov35-Phaeocystis_antarctica.AAC.3
MAVPRKRRVFPAGERSPLLRTEYRLPLSHWCVQSARSDTTYAQRGQSPGGARTIDGLKKRTGKRPPLGVR